MINEEKGMPFSYENMQQLVEACEQFCRNLERKEDASKRRIQLSALAKKFHEDGGTLSSDIDEAIGQVRDSSCILLMTAHQPNFFAYSGVLRKATLNYVLSDKLSERLNMPVVGFFGLADQDLTDDRWVKSSLLPDVERRNGLYELRAQLPQKMMLNKVRKPSKEALERWREDIENWLHRKTHRIKKFCREFKIEIDLKASNLLDNLGTLWRIVEEAYEKAENYSDFNAFIMSKIINETWGYNTLFCRFSECEQVFENEFSFLIRNFPEYSSHVKEATRIGGENAKGGVFEKEYQTIPFWYHCDCGSKVRLLADSEPDSLVGRGECLNCEKKYEIKLLSRGQPEISRILARISARSLSMPLLFFSGLNVSAYVGGIGGVKYLKQAKYVAEKMGIHFPPIVVWRPQDIYPGLGQFEATLTFRKISGTFDSSQYLASLARLRERISTIKNEIEKLELEKTALTRSASVAKKEIEKIKGVSARQDEIRRETDFSLLARDLRLLRNVESVIRLHPSIIDYAVNIGLRNVSEQWKTFLNRNGALASDIYLDTDAYENFSSIQREFKEFYENFQ